MGAFISADFLKIFLPLVGAVVAWFLNERRRHAWEEYLRKEDRYRELLRNLSGFYSHSADPEMRRLFIEEYKRCWLYCSDDVIKAANAAMDVMVEGTTVPMEQRRQILGEFVLAIRRDLLRRRLTKDTSLSSSDYRQIMPGK